MMIIDHSLRCTIEAVDLSDSDMRYGATALAILLLERILSAESKDPYSMSIYQSRLELEYNPYSEFKDELRVLVGAITTLYYAYGLPNLRDMGIAKYLRKIEAYTNLNPLR